jgi:hypothetical protein
MMPTPIALLQKAADLGLKLGVEAGDTLTVEPDVKCPPDFASTLKAHKWTLLPLLQSKGVTWIEVYSERLGETIFFCADEATKATLIEAGASEWSIYTRAELSTLCEANRVAPLSDAELRQVHTLKRSFNARIR